MKSCSESRSDRLLLFREGFGGSGEEVRAPPPPPPQLARLTRGGVVSRKQKEGKDQEEK